MIDTFCAASLNNMIYYPLDKDIFIDYSSNELIKFRNEVRNYYNNIIVGGNTINKNNPTLLNEKQSNKRFIIDKYGDINLNSNIFTIKPENTYLFLFKDNKTYINKLRKNKVHVITCNKDNIFIKLRKYLKGNTLVEGGSRTINYFLKNNFIDNIGLIVYPFLLPKTSKELFINTEKYYLKLLEQIEIDKQYLFIKYQVVKRRVK